MPPFVIAVIPLRPLFRDTRKSNDPCKHCLSDYHDEGACKYLKDDPERQSTVPEVANVSRS